MPADPRRLSRDDLKLAGLDAFAGAQTTAVCQQCGMVLRDAGEFHPWLFCRLKKLDGRREPWDDFRAAVELLGIELPERAPLVRDLPLKQGEQ